MTAAAKCIPVPLSRGREGLEKPVHEVLAARYQEVESRLLTREGLLLGRREESRELREFLESVLDTWRRKLRGERVTSRIAYVIGEWGMGKTAFADYAERLCRELRLTCVKQTFDHVKAELSKESLQEYRDKPRRLLERIVELLVGDRRLLGRREPIVVVVDEMEAIATPGGEEEYLLNMIVDQFLQLYKALVDPRVGEGDELLDSLRGRLHLILMLTPEAHMRLNNKISLLLGQEGRYERRPDKKIRLRPFPKDEFLELLDAYTTTTLGLSVREALGDARLVNTIYLLTNGAPGIALDLLRQLLEKAIGDCSPETSCLCRITPLRFLEYLKAITIVGEEGGSIVPVREAFLKDLLEKAGSDEEVLAIATASHVLPEEVGARTVTFLESMGIRLVEAIAAPLSAEGGGLRASETVSELLYAECAGRADCEQSLSTALEYFKQYSREWGLVLVLPLDYGVFREWVRHLGGGTGRLRREDYERIVEALSALPGARRVLVPTPDSLVKVYMLYGAYSLPYVTDRLKAREVMNRVLSLEAERQREFAEYAAVGFTAVLAAGMGSRVAEWHTGEAVLTLTLDYNGVNYQVPVEVKVHTTGESFEEGCGEEPRGLLVFTASPSVSARAPCSRVRYAYASPQMVREAAALGVLVSTGEYEGLVDKALLEEYARSIIQALSLEPVIRGIVEGLVADGVLVAMNPEARSILYGLLPSGIKNKEFAALDVYKFLLTYGPGRESTPDWLLENLTRLLALLPYKDTPGLKVPELSSTDLRDYANSSLKRLIEGSLSYLAKLGLVEGRATIVGSTLYRPVVPRDPLSRRLLELFSNGLGEGESLARLAESYFILPQDPANREEAVRRLLVSFNVLFQLGLVSFSDWRRYCSSFNCKVDKDHKLQGVEVSDLPEKYDVDRAEVSKESGELREVLSRAPRIYERLGMRGEGRLGDLIVCKQKKCMVTGASKAGAFIEEAGRIAVIHGGRVPRPASFLYTLLLRIASSLRKASNTVYSEVEDGIRVVEEAVASSAARLHEVLNRIVGSLADYPDEVVMELSAITSRARKAVNRLLDDYRAEVQGLIRRRFAEADALINCLDSPEQKGQKSCRQLINAFRAKRHLYMVEPKLRQGKKRLEDYSPHLQAYREIAATLEGKLAELEEKAQSLEKTMERLLNTISLIGGSIRSEAAGMLQTMVRRLEHAGTVEEVEKEIDKINQDLITIAKRSEQITKAKQQYQHSLSEIRNTLEEALPRLRQEIKRGEEEAEELIHLGGIEDEFLEKHRREAENLKRELAEALNNLARLETILKNTAINLEEYYKKMTTARDTAELDDAIRSIDQLTTETRELVSQASHIEERIRQAMEKLAEARKRATEELTRRTMSLAREDLATLQAITLQQENLPGHKLEALAQATKELKRIQSLAQRKNLQLQEAYSLYKKALEELEKALEALGPETTKTLRLIQELTRKSTITLDELTATVKRYYPNLNRPKLLEKIAETLELLERRGFKVTINLL